MHGYARITIKDYNERFACPSILDENSSSKQFYRVVCIWFTTVAFTSLFCHGFPSWNHWLLDWQAVVKEVERSAASIRWTWWHGATMSLVLSRLTCKGTFVFRHYAPRCQLRGSWETQATCLFIVLPFNHEVYERDTRNIYCKLLWLRCVYRYDGFEQKV